MTQIVIRRRTSAAGVEVARMTGGIRSFVLEPDAASVSISERLRRAAIRLDRAQGGNWFIQMAQTPLAYQHGVFEKSARYLQLTATALANPNVELFPPGRIIMPPRTGKTFVMGQMIAGCGLTTTMIVPTGDLVEQTATRLAEQIPGLKIGRYYGAKKQTVENGVNIATYTILQIRDAEEIPAPIRSSALVLCDEGHESMTVARQAMLAGTFAEGSVRIALTATPDYDEEHLLASHYPTLIHEMNFDEAVALQTLAPFQICATVVDLDASSVKFRAGADGDYVPTELAAIMRQAPVLETAATIRYEDPETSGLPALVCCATRQHAITVWTYLAAVAKSKGRPTPEILLEETRNREQIYGLFEQGGSDTIVAVAVPMRGWDSPACKLVIDLSPTTSMVRAKQKWCRPLTRAGTKTARIELVWPRRLRVKPALPGEVFGPSLANDTFAFMRSRSGRKSAMPREPLKILDAVDEVRETVNKRLLLQIMGGREKTEREQTNAADLSRQPASDERRESEQRTKLEAALAQFPVSHWDPTPADLGWRIATGAWETETPETIVMEREAEILRQWQALHPDVTMRRHWIVPAGLLELGKTKKEIASCLGVGRKRISQIAKTIGTRVEKLHPLHINDNLRSTAFISALKGNGTVEAPNGSARFATREDAIVVLRQALSAHPAFQEHAPTFEEFRRTQFRLGNFEGNGLRLLRWAYLSTKRRTNWQTLYDELLMDLRCLHVRSRWDAQDPILAATQEVIANFLARLHRRAMSIADLTAAWICHPDFIGPGNVLLANISNPAGIRRMIEGSCFVMADGEIR